MISGLSGVAENLEEMFGYGAGTAGKKLIFKESFYNKLENLMQGRNYLYLSSFLLLCQIHFLILSALYQAL